MVYCMIDLAGSLKNQKKSQALIMAQEIVREVMKHLDLILP